MNKQKKKRVYSYHFALSNYTKFKKKEASYKLKLNAGNYYIMRFDGSGMTAGFKIKHKAINEIYFNTMKKTFKNFAQKFPQIIMGYSFSDEISVLFKASNNNEDMFSRGSKLLSLLSGQLALEFYKAAQETKLDCKGKDWIFDARLIEVRQNEIVDYFKARQAFAIDKFLSQCKGEYALNYKLKNSNDIISALQKKGIDYNSFKSEYKFGLIYSSNSLVNSFEFFGNEDRLKNLYIDKDRKLVTAA
jgi:tRNA(His) 5'-end guanylyltransferase